MTFLLDVLAKTGALLAFALMFWAGATFLKEIRLTLERDEHTREQLARERAWRELRERVREKHRRA